MAGDLEKILEFECKSWVVKVFRVGCNLSFSVAILFCNKRNSRRRIYLPPQKLSHEEWLIGFKALPKYCQKIALNIASNPILFLKEFENGGGVGDAVVFEGQEKVAD